MSYNSSHEQSAEAPSVFDAADLAFQRGCSLRTARRHLAWLEHQGCPRVQRVARRGHPPGDRRTRLVLVALDSSCTCPAHAPRPLVPPARPANDGPEGITLDALAKRLVWLFELEHDWYNGQPTHNAHARLVSRLRRWHRKGKLVAVRVGRALRVPQDEAARLCDPRHPLSKRLVMAKHCPPSDRYDPERPRGRPQRFHEWRMRLEQYEVWVKRFVERGSQPAIRRLGRV